MSKKPALIAYSIRERGKGQKDIWTRIGAAWPHSSGTGFNIQPEALPMGDRIVLTEPKADVPRRRPKHRPKPSDAGGPSFGAAPFHFHHQGFPP